MARKGTAKGLAKPVVPEVNIIKNGSSALRITGAKSVDNEDIERQKSASPASKPCPCTSATVITVGHCSTSNSLLRFATSVTTNFAPEVCIRCSMALGPKAVNNG